MSQKIKRLDRGVARQIGTSRRSLTGRVPFRGKSVAFESSLERDFVALQEFDSAVEDVIAQPTSIWFTGSDGRPRRYTPDYLVRYAERAPLLCEVKYRSNLRDGWRELKPGFRAAIRYAKADGMRFAIFTEVEIRGSGFLGNANFLRQYRDRLPKPEIEEKLVRTLAALGETTPQALLLAAYWDQENRLSSIGSMWRLIAIGRICADLHLPLTMSTPIWVPSGEAFL